VVRSFRSLIYVNKRSQFRQIAVPCSDIVAGILKFDSLELMVVSVYVPCITDGSRSRAENRAELRHRLDLVRSARVDFEQRSGKKIQLFVGGDFNRHDQAWGGDGQLQIGHWRLRSFLAKLGFEDSPACECGERVETVRHFLLHCRRHQDLRSEMIERTDQRRETPARHQEGTKAYSSSTERTFEQLD
jgi:hypothetical protein